MITKAKEVHSDVLSVAVENPLPKLIARVGSQQASEQIGRYEASIQKVRHFHAHRC